MSEHHNVKTYPPREVCAAAGVPPTTFQMWMSRNSLPLPPAPGPGRERRFTFLDAVRVAVARELTRMDIGIGIAGAAAETIDETLIEPDIEPRVAIAIVPIGEDAGFEDGKKRRSAAWWSFRFNDWSEVSEKLSSELTNGLPAGFVFLDVTTIAERTRRALARFHASGDAGE